MKLQRRYNLECALTEQLLLQEDTWKDWAVGATGQQKLDDQILVSHYEQMAKRAFQLVKNLSDEELKEALE